MSQADFQHSTRMPTRKRGILAEPAPAPNTFPRLLPCKPADLPDRYCLTGEGDCLEPEIPDGALLVFDRTAPIRAGDLVGIYLRPKCVPPGGHQGLVKRLAASVPPWVKFPLRDRLGGNVQGAILAEQFNPARLLVILCAAILDIHRCLGPAPAGIRTTKWRPVEPRGVAPIAAGTTPRE